jgi:hypothetical protein
MIELFEILAGFLGVAVFVWLFLKLGVFLKITFGLERRRVPKVEIQTLFHGNTKDQDQI